MTVRSMRHEWTRCWICGRALVFDAIETRGITVLRTFADFDDFWTTTLISSLGPFVATMTPGNVELLKTRTRARLPADASGRITYDASAKGSRLKVSQVRFGSFAAITAGLDHVRLTPMSRHYSRRHQVAVPEGDIRRFASGGEIRRRMKNPKSR
jgi:hypothetical protein